MHMLICWYAVCKVCKHTTFHVDHTCGCTSDYDNAVDGDGLPVWGWGEIICLHGVIVLCCATAVLVALGERVQAGMCYPTGVLLLV